jgi:hypothetical protein
MLGTRAYAIWDAYRCPSDDEKRENGSCLEEDFPTAIIVNVSTKLPKNVRIFSFQNVLLLDGHLYYYNNVLIIYVLCVLSVSPTEAAVGPQQAQVGIGSQPAPPAVHWPSLQADRPGLHPPRGVQKVTAST